METNTKSYKDIKNYIHNDLGISYQEVYNLVIDAIKKTVEKAVDEALSDQDRLQYLVEKEVLRQIKYNKDKNRQYFIQCTLDSIYNKIDQVIHEEVLKRLVIDLKEE